jgi:hypothetical protein
MEPGERSPTRGKLSGIRTAAAIALGFFSSWLLVLYAGADRPPPPGFPVVIVLDLAAAFVVYRRVRVYAEWSRARRPKRWLRALFEGIAAGLIVAVLVLVLPFGSEPSIQRSAAATVVWVVVLAVVGGVTALLIYGLGAASVKRRSGPRSGKKESIS